MVRLVLWRLSEANVPGHSAGLIKRVSYRQDRSHRAMPEVHVHRMFFHFSELPLSTRTLFTATLIVLGIGYVFAMIQIYEVHSGLDGKAGLSAEDIAIA